MKWIEVSEKQYKEHCKELCKQEMLKIFVSYTNIEGFNEFGAPRIETEWGFEDSKESLVKIIAMADIAKPVFEDWAMKYFKRAEEDNND